MNKKYSALSFLLITAFVGTIISSNVFAAVFSSGAYLNQNTPGTAHQALPHGVPSNYDWQARAVLHDLNPPSPDSGYMNFWGQIYVDQTNVRPANTRVAVSACQFWGLQHSASSWTLLVNDSPTNLQGGHWREDFTSKTTGFDIRSEADGSMSMANFDGYNAHFWSRKPLVNAGTNYRAFYVACSARLVLANAAGNDDRSQSHYLLSMGADWRKSDYGCPLVNGITVCKSTGVGRFMKVTNEWRRIAFSSMSTAQSSQYPSLPTSAFSNPDGTYGEALPLTEPATPTPGGGGGGGSNPTTPSSPGTVVTAPEPGTPAAQAQQAAEVAAQAKAVEKATADAAVAEARQSKATAGAGANSKSDNSAINNPVTTKVGKAMVAGTGTIIILIIISVAFLIFRAHTHLKRR